MRGVHRADGAGAARAAGDDRLAGRRADADGARLLPARRAAEEGRVPAGMAVERTLQTNGVLLDDEWCAFLAENDYLVGLSLDGPRELHDAYRHDAGGRPVFDRVVAAARLPAEARRRVQRALHRATRPTRVTRSRSTASSATSSAPASSSSSRSSRSRRRRPAAGRAPSRDRSVQPEDYGALPQRRSSTSGCVTTSARCSCRPSTACSPPTCAAISSLCIFQPTCGEGVALEHNGDLYSCDHFVDPAYLLGNILETPVGELVRSEQQRAFGPRQAGDAAGLLPRLRVPLRLQRRVPQEPHPAHAGRRARPQLAVRRAQGRSSRTPTGACG